MSLIYKALFTFLLFSFFSTVSSFTHAADNVAPDFELPSQYLSDTQSNIKLSEKQGKIVYLDFWASWCGPCKQSFPWMNEMQDKYRAQGFEVIAVNLDSNTDDANKFLLSNPAKFTVAFDSKGKTPLQYGVKGMPTSYLIGRDGKIVQQHMGFKASDREQLEQKIKLLLAEKK
jgi:cytochrome c biogenesis protein CcmG, thiol:disulfide interchange protein DsbE